MKLIVLVVSEDPRHADWVRLALGPDCQIEDVRNGIEALAMLRSSDYDVVIADETTEPYGGFGLAREIKFDPDPPAVIVLLERAQDSWLAKWSGADRWLLRPIDPFELARTVTDLSSQPAAENERIPHERTADTESEQARLA